VAAEDLQVPEEDRDGDAPGDRAEREVVAGEAERDGAEDRGGERGEREGRGEADPRRVERSGAARGDDGRRVRGDPDERRLSERREAAHAGEEDEPERDERVQADVDEQHHAVLAEEGRRRGDGGEDEHRRERLPRACRTGAAHSSSSTWCVRSERHRRTGRMSVNTISSR
jgi:hypothetical protein